MQRLADLRINLKTIDEAKILFNQLASQFIWLAREDAKTEKRIADIKLKHEENTAAGREHADNLKDALLGFIEAHRELFQSPRKVVTDFGSFGLQKVTDVVVDDERTLVQALLDRGYDGCLKTTRKPVKKRVKDHMKAGESLPGCELREGDTAVYKITKSLIDEARENAG